MDSHKAVLPDTPKWDIPGLLKQTYQRHAWADGPGKKDTITWVSVIVVATVIIATIAFVCVSVGVLRWPITLYYFYERQQDGPKPSLQVLLSTKAPVWKQSSRQTVGQKVCSCWVRDVKQWTLRLLPLLFLARTVPRLFRSYSKACACEFLYVCLMICFWISRYGFAQWAFTVLLKQWAIG